MPPASFFTAFCPLRVRIPDYASHTNEKKPIPVKTGAVKFKGRTIRDKIKAINYTSDDDEITAEIGELITDADDKKGS